MASSTIVGIQTSVPAFIGYTAQATLNGEPCAFTPVPIDSMAAYETIFGGQERFNLYNALQLFYANGGANCYVVSVGDDSGTVRRQDLEQGLNAIADPGPTMIVIPDAVLLPNEDDFAAIAQQMLTQAAMLGDRFAILDVYGGEKVTDQASFEQTVRSFRKTVNANLSYGAAYFPFLETTAGVVPPSGAMAGIYTAIDQSKGVWSAPANVALAGITALTFDTNKQQGFLFDPEDGKTINAIREFSGQGSLVWGARTLDGNSNDYRYIQVRRELIYIEQSIKVALQQFVFAANDGTTWATVTALIANFLTTIWSEGGLMGDSAADAFSVQCGLGSTMSGQDILNGLMRVQVLLSMVRPAEFIELTFEQKMASSQ